MAPKRSALRSSESPPGAKDVSKEKKSGAGRWLRGAVGGRSKAATVKGAPDPTPDEDPSPPPAPARGAVTVKAPLVSLTSSNTLEEFFDSGLMQTDGYGALVVPHSEPLSVVVEQLHSRRISSCIVTLPSGQQDAFDCIDFGSHVLEAVLGATSKSGPSTAQVEDWEATKKRLRKLASEPIRKALRGGAISPKGGSISPKSGSNGLRGFDSDEGLRKLLPMFREQSIVPLFRQGELSRLLSATDVLELCLSVSEDTRARLEQTPLAEVIAKSPGMLTKLEVTEDHSLAEAMHLMCEANVHVVPILASAGANDDEQAVERRASMEDGGKLVGQFDIAALRTLFLPGMGSDSEGEYWWEDSNMTSSIFAQTCMDFHALVPSSAADDRAPYAAVLSSEPLARAISRAAASTYQSVVVYHHGASPRSTGARQKFMEGVASSRGLIVALFEAGVFQSLTFDASKLRRPRDSMRRPTLTAADVQSVLGSPANDAPQRKTKVTFISVIELDALCVPTCPEHGMHFMRYSKDEDPKNIMDFHALKDWVSDAKALQAGSHCLACRRNFGKICARPSKGGDEAGAGVAESAASIGTAFLSGMFDRQRLSGSGEAGKAAGASPKVNSTPATPTKSSLKAGTPGSSNVAGAGGSSPQRVASGAGLRDKKNSGPIIGKKENERQGSRGASNGNGHDSAGGRAMLFGLCCVSPSQCAGSKDQIATASSTRITKTRVDGPVNG